MLCLGRRGKYYTEITSNELTFVISDYLENRLTKHVMRTVESSFTETK